MQVQRHADGSVTASMQLLSFVVIILIDIQLAVPLPALLLRLRRCNRQKKATQSGGEVRNKLFESRGGQRQPPVASPVFLFFPPQFSAFILSALRALGAPAAPGFIPSLCYYLIAE